MYRAKLAISVWLLFTGNLWSQPDRIIVVGEVQDRMLVHQVEPTYPRLARQAHIQGTVKFVAIIDRDGSVARLKLVSGHPLLEGAAFNAVRQWRYAATVVRGRPVVVVTTIEIAFSLDRSIGLPERSGIVTV